MIIQDVESLVVTSDGEGLGIKATAITWMCEKCDSTHVAVHLPNGISIFLAFDPTQVAQLIPMIQNPQSKDEAEAELTAIDQGLAGGVKH